MRFVRAADSVSSSLTAPARPLPPRISGITGQSLTCAATAAQSLACAGALASAAVALAGATVAEVTAAVAARG